MVAGFVGFISVFNLLGRFFWSSVSDCYRPEDDVRAFHCIGHGALLRSATLDGWGRFLVAVAFAIRATMYGGGFANSAHLRDLFAAGTRWELSMDACSRHGLSRSGGAHDSHLSARVPGRPRVAKVEAYPVTRYEMAAPLVAGFVCKALVAAVDARHHA